MNGEDAQEARDDRDEARDDRDQARDDRDEARDERAGMTRDDLDPLAVQVVALRQDLAAYRWAIERILRRRLMTTIVTAVVGLALIGAMIVSARTLLEQEEERAARTLEIARLEACATVRVLQGQVVAVLTALPPPPEGEAREWLPAALERLSADPCGPDVEDPLSRPQDPRG